MDKIEFKKIHNVIIDFLQEENNNELAVIGSWYFRFLVSNQEKLSLHLPYCSEELLTLSFNYIRAFTVVFNLLKGEKLTEFEGTCLFDIFNASSCEKMDELTLDFIKLNENHVLWGENTLTKGENTLAKLDAFLPVFSKEEIIRLNKSKTIKNTFELFKSIRKTEVFDFPLLIELDETMLSFNNLENIDNEFISENLFFVDSTLDDDSAMELEDQLMAQELNNSLLIKYPYSKKPHDYLIDIAKKKFKLVFNNRFAYNDILKNDLVLLKDEANLTTKIEYTIIDTNHSKDLYELFRSFNEQWFQLELNKFTTPFPKYWLLFLNASLTNEEWLKQFKKDFPAVAEKPIIRTIEKIIDEVIELNWIESVLTDSTIILFPELKSLRKKRLEFVYNNFRNYVTSLNKNVEFIDKVESHNYKNVKVFDSFNIIYLANLNQFNCEDTINVMVPDFLYFGYKPFIKLYLFNYQFTPLFIGLREALDENYISNKEEIEELKIEIKRGIKLDLKNYRSKYKDEIEDEIEDENPNLEDLEFTNAEEIENTASEVNHENKIIIINQYLENELAISSTEKVLLQKDTLIFVKAFNLKKGDFFVRNIDISELYKSNNLYDKLVNIPQDVLKYQNQLFKKENVYQTLKNKGISYQHQNYFDNNYVLEINEEHTFRISRRKKDWAIICEFLNINHSDQQLAFIAYYGRSKQNDLKKMYKSIIELLLENNWLGKIEDPTIINTVSKIVNKYNSIFNTTDKTEITEISESIISTILSQLTLTEIKTIKK
ncbi:hypothetical protein [uncultured Eudoraea sp.]|uniref:hypothetical protein n=1 Tax=uncultured Eudoraea sp. TaxID=1035614 RepID=UPI002613093B|nr:hypothetical protein [uncultured Eudoraea sp.]